MAFKSIAVIEMRAWTDEDARENIELIRRNHQSIADNQDKKILIGTVDPI